MERKYTVDQKFDKIDFTQEFVPFGDYEECSFQNCSFSNADLSQLHFSECVFNTCNLSMAKLVKTTFQQVRFADCKLLGLHFENCNPLLFSVQFEKCDLHLSSFYKLKMPKTIFRTCLMKDVDLAEADLSSSLFDQCDLAGAMFENSILEKADFRTSFNYTIDPELNRIKRAKFSFPGVVGLLSKYQIEIDL